MLALARRFPPELMLASALSLLALFALLSVWDYVLAKTGRRTISDRATALPPIGVISVAVGIGAFFGFVAGLLTGHWWWPNS